MNRCFSDLGRCISILDRLMKMYYDHGLSNFEIGWGSSFMWNIFMITRGHLRRRW